jgi:hypothetical protein
VAAAAIMASTITITGIVITVPRWTIIGDLQRQAPILESDDPYPH